VRLREQVPLPLFNEQVEIAEHICELQLYSTKEVFTMADIHAQTGGIHDKAATFANQSVELGDLITKVNGTLEELQSYWKGPAAIQFNDLMNEWHKDVNDIKQVLETVAEKVKGAGTGYEDLDGQIQRSFRF